MWNTKQTAKKNKSVFMKNMVFFVVRRKKSCPHTLKKNFFEERPGRVFLINSPLILLKKGNFFAKPASHHSIVCSKLGKMWIYIWMMDLWSPQMLNSTIYLSLCSHLLRTPQLSIWRNLSKRRFLKTCEAF